MSPATDHVVVARHGRVGRLSLARPTALNALDRGMIDALARGLESHVADDAVEIVVIDSRDPRAFCAGGDMKRARELVLQGRFDAMDDFFAAEYALDLAVARCPKPYVALIDGVAMGGGLGISVHGSHRVVTERAALAMPETRIGFFPDVGASRFLPRLAGRAGWWLGTTGDTIDGATAVAVGLATHRLRSDALPTLLARLEDPASGSVEEALAAVGAADAAEDGTRERLARLDDWFAADTRDAIEDALEEAAPRSGEAERLLGTLRGVSPHGVDTALALLRDAGSRSLAESLERERAVARDAVRHPDFVEGIRAVLVDRDARPRWARR